MKLFIKITIGLLLIIIVLSGCTKPNTSLTPVQPAKEGTPKEIKSSSKTEGLPKNKKSIIKLEGTDQQFNLNLLDGSPLPFYTYVPGDMLTERTSSGEGDIFKIMANFAGNKREDAYLSIYFFHPETTMEQAVKFANTSVINNKWQKVAGPNGTTPKIYNWSTSEWHVTNKTNNTRYLGTIALGKHQDRIFYIMTHYPEDFAEGFAPRSNKVLDEFTWIDTAEKLNAK